MSRSSVVRQRVRAALGRVKAALRLGAAPGRSHPQPHAWPENPVEAPGPRPAAPLTDGATILTVAQLRDW